VHANALLMSRHVAPKHKKHKKKKKPGGRSQAVEECSEANGTAEDEQRVFEEEGNVKALGYHSTTSLVPVPSHKSPDIDEDDSGRVDGNSSRQEESSETSMSDQHQSQTRRPDQLPLEKPEAVESADSHESAEDDTSARLEALANERTALRDEVTRLRQSLQEVQQKHQDEVQDKDEQLEAVQGEKEYAQDQYQSLLGRVNTLKAQLGERLKADAVCTTLSFPSLQFDGFPGRARGGAGADRTAGGHQHIIEQAKSITYH